jgi:Protein of unknown function (DUF3631)
MLHKKPSYEKHLPAIDASAAKAAKPLSKQEQAQPESIASSGNTPAAKTEAGNGHAGAIKSVSDGTPCPLDAIEIFLGRFVAYPSAHAKVAHVLWIAHTHVMDAWDSTPRIAFLSPEPGSGKSRALEVSELLVPRPVQSVNVTPAYLFRKVGDESGRPTVLFDEVDTVFGPKARDSNEEIRGLLNAGHRRHSTAGRCVIVGKTVRTEELPAYCAVALAGLGEMPDTILSRCIVVRMRRRAPGEVIEPFRHREHREQAQPLRERIEAWAATIADDVQAARPVMPPGVVDRDADVWEPLLAIADAAGAGWADRARSAATALVKQAKQSTPSLGVRLLGDLRQVFGNRDSMPTDTICNALCDIEEAPWADLRGKPIDARGLAGRLKPYGIKSRNVRVDEKIVLKGYERGDLLDAWQRYLEASPIASATSATGATNCGDVAGVALVARAVGEVPSGRIDPCPACAGQGCNWCAEKKTLPADPATEYEVF